MHPARSLTSLSIQSAIPTAQLLAQQHHACRRPPSSHGRQGLVEPPGHSPYSPGHRLADSPGCWSLILRLMAQGKHTLGTQSGLNLTERRLLKQRGTKAVRSLLVLSLLW